MREILFRGKRPNGKWVQGDLTLFRIDEKITSKISFHTTRATLNGLRTITYTDEVIPETIGQYTSLTDKNGKRIFEGDIVSISGELKGIYACVWEENNFEYEFNNKAMSFGLACVHSDDIEVIGNIHDSPELLKGCEGK